MGAAARVWPLAVALAVLAFNLRPAVTSLGPLLDDVRHDLGMNATVAGLLTSVPTVCFAIFGGAAPALARRLGPGVAALLGMAVLTLGLATRALAPNTAVFLLLSAVALAGIATTNVLMPVLVKRYFPDRIGPMTGVYSMALSAGTAVAAGVSVPLTHALGGGWRPGLAAWAVPAAVAALCWLPRLAELRRDRASGSGHRSAEGAGAEPGSEAAAGATAATATAVADRQARPRTSRPAAGPAAAGPAAAGPVVRPAVGPESGSAGRRRGITRSRTAWFLAVFFGMQSTAAYVTMGWLPQMFQDAGLSAGTSGALLALTMAVGAPLSFVLPALAARRPNQGPFAVLLALCGAGAYAGLAFAPAAAPVLWALLAGLANSTFPLVLTMIGLRARSAPGVARLSAFAQSTGYLLAIPGPILVGTLYQHTGGWDAPLALLTVLLVPQAVSGWLAGRPRHVEDEMGVAD